MERQADFLAASILMPRPALRVAYREFFRYYNDKPRRIIRGTSPLDDCYAKQLPEYIAKLFNVSNKAALIRLGVYPNQHTGTANEKGGIA